MLRARKDEDKEQRRRVFLAAAKALFDTGSLATVTMADVARRVGLAKGTVFLYFPTKEALFLDLLQDELAVWLDDVDAFLGELGSTWTPDLLARRIADSIAERGTMTRLLTLLTGVLEHNVEPAHLVRFKTWLARRLRFTGALLEQRVPSLPAGGGTRLLLRIDALVVGLHHLTEPGSVVNESPELALFTLDFKEELRTLIAALLRA